MNKASNMNPTIHTTYHDDWDGETTQVNCDVKDILSRLDEPTVEIPLDELNKQLAQAFPVVKPLEIEVDYVSSDDD